MWCPEAIFYYITSDKLKYVTGKRVAETFISHGFLCAVHTTTESKIIHFHIANMICERTALIKSAFINIVASLVVSRQHFSSKMRQFVAFLDNIGNVNLPG